MQPDRPETTALSAELSTRRSRRPAGLKRWGDQAAAFAGRHLRQYLRSPVSLLFVVVWPAFWYLLVSRLLFDTGSAEVATIATAKAAFALSFGLFGAFTVSMTGVVGTFTADIGTKRYRKFRSLPIAPSADVLGRFAAGAVLSLVSYAGLLTVGFLDGAAFVARSLWSPAIVIVSVLAFTGIGVGVAIAIASGVPKPEYATTLATAIVLATFFGTGFNGVSPGLFPGPAWLLNVIPVSLITRVQLAHLVGPSGAATGAFHPPPLPTHPIAVVLIVGYGAAALAVGTGIVTRHVYRGEAGE